MKELRKQLDDQRQADWTATIAMESHLLPHVLKQQRTIRAVLKFKKAADPTPYWSIYKETEEYFNIKRSVESWALRKLRAWWELLLEVQRVPDDEPVIKLALAYVVQEVLKTKHGQNRPVDPSAFGIVSPQINFKVQTAVRSRIKDLLPSEVGPGVELKAMLRLKLEAQPVEN